MEYKTNESKFRTKDWVEINDESNKVKFKFMQL